MKRILATGRCERGGPITMEIVRDTVRPVASIGEDYIARDVVVVVRIKAHNAAAMTDADLIDGVGHARRFVRSEVERGVDEWNEMEAPHHGAHA